MICEAIVVGQKVAADLSGAGHDHRVGQPQIRAISTQFGSSLGHRRGERRDLDPYRRDGSACIGKPSGASKRNERLAVRARGHDQLAPRLIACLDVADGALVVRVSGVEQSDQDARVEDQRSHSSRSCSSSPAA